MRRMIIGTAVFATYCFVFIVAISAGVAGYVYGTTLGFAENFAGNDQTTQVISALVGLVGGFLLASVAAATLLLLADIAANTRRTVRMLDSMEGRERPGLEY